MHTACEPTHPWSFFHPDTIQTQSTIHWFCSVPWVHLYNPLKNRLPLAQPRTEFIKELFVTHVLFTLLWIVSDVLNLWKTAKLLEEPPCPPPTYRQTSSTQCFFCPGLRHSYRPEARSLEGWRRGRFELPSRQVWWYWGWGVWVGKENPCLNIPMSHPNINSNWSLLS